jgi:hypothetical protein
LCIYRTCPSWYVSTPLHRRFASDLFAGPSLKHASPAESICCQKETICMLMPATILLGQLQRCIHSARHTPGVCMHGRAGKPALLPAPLPTPEMKHRHPASKGLFSAKLTDADMAPRLLRLHAQHDVWQAGSPDRAPGGRRKEFPPGTILAGCQTSDSCFRSAARHLSVMSCSLAVAATHQPEFLRTSAMIKS